jgi:hypothetical protein
MVRGNHLPHDARITTYIYIRKDDAYDIDEYLSAIIEAVEGNAFPDLIRDNKPKPAVVEGYEKASYEVGLGDKYSGIIIGELVIILTYHGISVRQ